MRSIEHGILRLKFMSCTTSQLGNLGNAYAGQNCRLVDSWWCCLCWRDSSHSNRQGVQAQTASTVQGFQIWWQQAMKHVQIDILFGLNIPSLRFDWPWRGQSLMLRLQSKLYIWQINIDTNIDSRAVKMGWRHDPTFCGWIFHMRSMRLCYIGLIIVNAHATKQDTLCWVNMHTVDSDATCLVLMKLFLTLFKNRY